MVAGNFDDLGVEANAGEKLRDAVRHLILEAAHGFGKRPTAAGVARDIAEWLGEEGQARIGDWTAGEGNPGPPSAARHRQLGAAARRAYRRLPEDARVILGQLRGEQDPLLAERFPTLAEAARLARVARHAVPPTTEALIRAAFSEFNPEETEHAGQVLLLRRQAEELERAAAAAHAFAAENGDEAAGEQAAGTARGVTRPEV